MFRQQKVVRRCPKDPHNQDWYYKVTQMSVWKDYRLS